MRSSNWRLSMGKPKIEEVFKTSGIPTFTFVKPTEYDRLIVGLRTPGRGLVIEGPSGIGKTTSVIKALEELGIHDGTTTLSARKSSDRDYIKALPSMGAIGTVLIDDFHRLDEETKQSVADYMKTLADEENAESKIIVLGINKAGLSLVKFATDLNNRIDTISFEANPENKVEELISKGEEALNIQFACKKEIIEDAHGSFHIAQMICREMCISSSVLENQEQRKELIESIATIRERVLDELGRVFYDQARKLATGPKLRREGRSPYLHVMHWLSQSEDWSLQLDQAIAQNPEHKASVGQIVEKDYLKNYLDSNKEFSEVIHYDPMSRMLSIEDPKFFYFLKNIIWNKFAKQIGYASVQFKSKYDFALSFAGADRDVAEKINTKLVESEASVFYDKNEQHRILANNIEDYLAPIYRSEAEYIIVLLGREYPKRVWTKFESEQFKHRFGDNSIIPIWFTDAPQGLFDESSKVGGITFDRANDIDSQIANVVNLLLKKLFEVRQETEPGVLEESEE